MAVLVGMGDQMVERFVPVYLIALTASPALPGIFQALHNIVGALYAFPGGWLAERLGPKRALLVFNLVAITGYAFVILVPRWQAMLVGSLLFLSWSSVSLPGTMGLIASSLPKHQQVMGVSLHSLVRRVPKALGPLVGGLCIDIWGVVDGVRVAFALAIAMALVSVFVQQALIEDDRPPAVAEAPTKNPFRLFRSFCPELKSLFVSDVLIRFCEQIPYAYVTIWCMNEIAGLGTARVDGVQFGVLTTIEMAVAVLCYVPVARQADRLGKKPFVVATFAAFTLFPAVLFFSRSYAALVVAFVVRGLKEFGEPTRKALIMHLAPEGRQTAAFGTYYLFRDSVISLAALLGAALWQVGPGVNLGCAFGFGVAGTVWFACFGRGQARDP
ncbi:MAG TPA: MFS transporter [Planctomycetota bacterium]|nr:MFS transporter [Planctomycetota bacterium]